MAIGKTAILFFSRTQQDEHKAKTFGLSDSHFANLYKFVVNKALSTAYATGLNVIESYSDQQKGNSFNERLIHALKQVSEQGYKRVIVIGNDSPELTTDDVLIAEKQLANGCHVLGKNKRGGVYLIGIDFESFDLSRLAEVRWNSNAVFTQLKLQLESIYELAIKHDLNERSDIRDLIKSKNGLGRGIFTFLLNLLRSLTILQFRGQRLSHQKLQVALSYRGPPSLI
ncbi:DUF2064 domain-containing protein [Roseivirga sp.]|uniref:DUF2064 domain-containing protein n=1 Tax=Roseivirga sp. TaxID=1964215 RepID=UPI003B8C02B9